MEIYVQFFVPLAKRFSLKLRNVMATGQQLLCTSMTFNKGLVNTMALQSYLFVSTGIFIKETTISVLPVEKLVI